MMCRAIKPMIPKRAVPGTLTTCGGGQSLYDTQEVVAPAFTYNGSAISALMPKTELPIPLTNGWARSLLMPMRRMPNHDKQCRATTRLMPKLALPGSHIKAVQTSFDAHTSHDRHGYGVGQRPHDTHICSAYPTLEDGQSGFDTHWTPAI